MVFQPIRVAGALTGCVMLVGIGGPAAGEVHSSSSTDRVTVDGSVPTWATARAKLGEADTGEQRRVQVALALRDPHGAEVLARSLSSPGSHNYRKFLTSKQFAERFAPKQSTVDNVAEWLRSQGLRIEGVSSNRRAIDVAGSTGQFEAAFGVSLAKFRLSTRDGRSFVLTAPESPISVPRAVRNAVSGVLGLDDSARTITVLQAHSGRPAGSLDSMTRPAAPGDPGACARYWGEANNTGVPQKYPAGLQSNIVCGYTAPQIRAIYGLSAVNTGAGSTVAVVGAYNLATIEADTNRAAATFGAPGLVPGQYSAVLPPTFDSQGQCGPDGWNAEQALDVQAIHEVAPAAQIVYYAGRSCFDMLNTLNKAVAENKASVISASWGYPGESIAPAAEREQLNAIAVQAAIQGQAILFSSADTGDASAVTGHAEPAFPAAHPWVTAVGGTSVALDAQNKVTFTAGWENSGYTQNGATWVAQQDKDGRFAGGAGGGVSGVYDAPDYQKGVVPAAIGKGKRAVPDISALADNYTGFAYGFTTTQGWRQSSVGGTSLAAPLIAGLVADAQQAQNVARMGFLNSALYDLAGKASMSDVTPVAAGVWTPFMAAFGGVSVPTQPGSYLVDIDSKPQSLQSAAGWDLVTGVGTPTTGFVTALGS